MYLKIEMYGFWVHTYFRDKEVPKARDIVKDKDFRSDLFDIDESIHFVDVRLGYRNEFSFHCRTNNLFKKRKIVSRTRKLIKEYMKK